MGHNSSKEANAIQNPTRCIEDQSEAPAETYVEYGRDADVRKWKTMCSDINKLYDEICRKHWIVGRAYSTSRKLVLTPIIDFLTDLINNSRPPVIYILGRSGHGKSSLINALTGKDVAEVGHTSPTTPFAQEYKIRFEGQNCAWIVVDSHGIFESTKPKDSTNASVFDEVKKDLSNYKPDVILHVVCSTEARNLHNDLEFLQEIFNSFKTAIGAVPPVITVLSKADIIGTRQWPPEDHPPKKLILEEVMTYMSKNILSAKEMTPLDNEASFYGYELKDCTPFLFIIPTATNQQEPEVVWNIDKLSLIIGSKLPCQAWLHYYKAHKNQTIMKGMTLQIIAKFSGIAAMLGAIPGPGVSIVLLTPLIIIMVALIARLAGSDFSKESIWSYLQGSAKGVTCAVAGATGVVSMLALAEITETVLFGIGCAVGAVAASCATFCVGKAAEAYFFNGAIVSPESFKKDWKPPAS